MVEVKSGCSFLSFMIEWHTYPPLVSCLCHCACLQWLLVLNLSFKALPQKALPTHQILLTIDGIEFLGNQVLE